MKAKISLCIHVDNQPLKLLDTKDYMLIPTNIKGPDHTEDLIFDILLFVCLPNNSFLWVV